MAYFGKYLKNFKRVTLEHNKNKMFFLDVKMATEIWAE